MTDTQGKGRRPVRQVKLFIAGDEPNSRLALQNFHRLRQDPGLLELDFEIVDVLESYRIALEYRVLVTPCLVVLQPEPVVMVVGTLSDIERVRAALRLPPSRVSEHVA